MTETYFKDITVIIFIFIKWSKKLEFPFHVGIYSMLKREKWLSISILAHILFNPHFLSLVRLDDVFKLQHHTLKKKKKDEWVIADLCRFYFQPSRCLFSLC